MAIRILVMTVICFVKCRSAANLSGHIDGGQYSHIWQFPHSVALSIRCGVDYYGCGSSVVNQVILLTAAHCVEMCEDPAVFTYAGHEHVRKGLVTTVTKIIMHKDYMSRTITNDLALLRLKNELKFGENIRRVILMRHPPYDVHSFVAGWGRVWPGGPGSIYLKHISQVVYKREECYKIGLRIVPIGTICGEHKHKLGNPENGDSGSAMVTRNIQIQIGIVSFADLSISMTNTVYTDTGYFYDWIKENAETLYCANASSPIEPKIVT